MPPKKEKDGKKDKKEKKVERPAWMSEELFALSQNYVDLSIVIKGGKLQAKGNEPPVKCTPVMAAQFLFQLAMTPRIRDDMVAKQCVAPCVAALPAPDFPDNPSPFIGVIYALAKSELGADQLLTPPPGKKTVPGLLAFVRCSSSAAEVLAAGALLNLAASGAAEKFLKQMAAIPDAYVQLLSGLGPWQPPAARTNIARVIKTCAAFGVPNAGGGAIGATDPQAALAVGDVHRAAIGAVGVPKLLELVADDKAPREARSEAALTIGLLATHPANRAPLLASGALRQLPRAVVHPELTLEARTAAAAALKELVLPPKDAAKVITDTLLRAPTDPGPPVLVQRFTPLGGAVPPSAPDDPHDLLIHPKLPFAAPARGAPRGPHALTHGFVDDEEEFGGVAGDLGGAAAMPGTTPPGAAAGGAAGAGGAGAGHQMQRTGTMSSTVSGGRLTGTGGHEGGAANPWHPGQGNPGGPVGTVQWPYGGWEGGSGWGGGVLVKPTPAAAAASAAAAAAAAGGAAAAPPQPGAATTPGTDFSATARFSPTDDTLEGMVARLEEVMAGGILPGVFALCAGPEDAPAWEAKLAEAWAARGRAEVAATAASKLLQSGGLPAGGADASKRPPSAPAGESAPAAGAEGNAAAEEADGAEDAGADEEGEGTPAEGAETKPATPAEDAKSVKSKKGAKGKGKGKGKKAAKAVVTPAMVAAQAAGAGLLRLLALADGPRRAIAAAGGAAALANLVDTKAGRPRWAANGALMNIAGDADAVKPLSDAGVPPRVITVARPAKVRPEMNALDRAVAVATVAAAAAQEAAAGAAAAAAGAPMLAHASSGGAQAPHPSSAAPQRPATGTKNLIISQPPEEAVASIMGGAAAGATVPLPPRSASPKQRATTPGSKPAAAAAK